MLYRLIAKFRKFFTTKFYAKASVRGEKGKEKGHSPRVLLSYWRQTDGRSIEVMVVNGEIEHAILL
jgi:hypothetical protein